MLELTKEEHFRCQQSVAEPGNVIVDDSSNALIPSWHSCPYPPDVKGFCGVSVGTPY